MSTSAISGIIPTVASQTLTLPNGYITSIGYQNSGQQLLVSGIATSGIVFKPGELASGRGLTATIGGVQVAVQVDVKTTYADGSAKMAVLSLARPDIAAGATVEALLAVAPAGTLSPPALNLDTALAGHSFAVDITTAGVTSHVDVLAALHDALAHGTASFWQSGALASQARVEVALGGSQRLVFDVTAFANGGFDVEAQFNNDRTMEAVGGRVAYSVAVTMDGHVVAQESVDQGQYQNWHRSFASDGRNGGQGLGDAAHGWLNIRQDLAHLEATGAVAHYDQGVGLATSVLDAEATAVTAQGWNAPLATDGVSQFMPATGGRGDIGFTTAANTGWLITQDIRAANYALDQAEAASGVPWNHWDAAHKGWLSTDNYPLLWTDPRGGTGTPGNANSTGLTQQPDALTGWSLDSAHQPDLSYVPYVLTGERWILDNLQAQAAWNVVSQWPAVRHNGDDLVVLDNQVRGAAWSLRQIDEAAWASPDGSAAKAYFTAVSHDNWAWLVAQIPVWTAQQGEAHGWLPGVYGIAGAMPPWQQDYFASTTIAAAKQGNADALTFLNWEANFLVGRFTHAAEGFAPHDGATYLIGISDPVTGVPYTSWAQIGAATVAGGGSNGTGWAHSQGDYPQLALATLAGIAEVTGSSAAAAAYHALLADNPPFTTAADYNSDPTFAIAAPGSVAAPIPTPTPVPVPVPVPPVATGEALSIILGAEAWNGAPIAIVKVDGVQVFNGEVTASHASGGAAIQLGLFDPHVAHAVTVTFTKDLWGGTATADRNLYVEDITVNGVSTGNHAALLSNGDAAFTIPAAVIAPIPAPTPVPVPVPVQAGDTLRLSLSEDAWQGDAHYRVTLDGVVLVADGVATASHAAGAHGLVDLHPALAAGPHSLVVSFTNDAWGGAASTDRNLYVDAVLLNGVDLGKHAALMSNGDANISFDNTAVIVPTPVVNTLRLSLSEDAWQGDAHYSVTLDGAVLVADGVATASHAAGAHGLVDLHPALAAGPHSLVVSFTNDAWGGTAATDRNLYVDAISLNGLDLGKQAALLSAGHASFTFTSAAAVIVPVVAANDTLHIGLSADSWQGDPRFLIFIDGKQVGLEHSAAASHAAGQVEFLDVLVAHTAGVHQLDVRFTNDAWGGTAATDRNLYVESVALNGVDLHAHAALLSAGDAIFAF